MGNTAHIIKISAAIVFVVLNFAGSVTGNFRIVLLLLGNVFGLTSLVGLCPLYSLLGTNTGPKTNL